MNTMIKWLYRLVIVLSLSAISFSVGCVVRGESSWSFHSAFIAGHVVLLVVNLRGLLKHHAKEYSPNETNNR